MNFPPRAIAKLLEYSCTIRIVWKVCTRAAGEGKTAGPRTSRGRDMLPACVPAPLLGCHLVVFPSLGRESFR